LGLTDQLLIVYIITFQIFNIKRVRVPLKIEGLKLDHGSYKTPKKFLTSKGT